MGQLQGKVAIITGAGSGFGEGMAEAYVREGAKVIIADLNADAGERVAKALGATRRVRFSLAEQARSAAFLITNAEGGALHLDDLLQKPA